MENNKVFEKRERELDLIAILQLLNKKKVVLLVSTLIVGMITAGATLLLPNVYSSSTSMILDPPKYEITQQVNFLTIEMLEALSSSIDIKRTLHNYLVKAGYLEETMRFEDFQETLVVWLKRKFGPNREPLPMIQLIVNAKDPELAADIANEWGRIIITRVESLFKSTILQTSSFVNTFYTTANDNLIQSEDAYTSAVSEANLEINKLILERKRETYSSLYDDYLELFDTLQITESKIEELKNRLSTWEVDGTWFGEKYYAAYRAGKSDTIAVLTPEARLLTNVIASIANKEENLGEYKKTSEINYKENHLKDVQKQLTEVHANLIEARMSLTVAKEKYRELEAKLKDIPDKDILKKAITDDALWAQYFQGTFPETKEIPTLKSEEINLVRRDVQTSFINVSAEIKELEAKAQFLQNKEASLKGETNSLSQEIFLIQSEITKKDNALTYERNLLTFFEEEYSKTREDFQVLQLEYTITRAQADTKMAELTQLSDEIRLLELQIFKDENKINILKRRMENYASIENTFASKHDEMFFLKESLSGEGVNLHGIAVLDIAQANPRKVKPTRSKIVLTSMVIGFIIISLFHIVSWLIKER